ncbi:reelin domain-containing protein 1 [Pyxicephalus adspersus]|uniref:reelin domain-containing protein 1 n=1 Tax=Pyxicephalus adspersus TaxID=30357 RepID=UPI003B58EF94
MKVEDTSRSWLQCLIWICISAGLVSYSAAYSHGGSLAACSDMRPKHIRAQPQNPRKNYITIHTNHSFYLPGDKVPVTVRSTRDFMGFFLQARRVLNDQVAGSFVFIPPGSKLLHCFEDGDTVTHSDKSLKRNLSFVWKSPDQPVGDIKFFVSVVQSYFVYWARIESAIVSGHMLKRTLETERNLFGLQGPHPTLCPSCRDESKILSSDVRLSLPTPSLPPDSLTVFPISTSPSQGLQVDPTEFTLQESQSYSWPLSTIGEQRPTNEVAANFLQQPESASSEKNIKVEESTSPLVTKTVHETGIHAKGGEKGQGMHLAMTQLGILLGCSVVLGMSLAAGLRCIHAQYCHKRTEVSFSEPDDNVITLRENGEMMQFKKFRENSFVLVQAEYNWITPALSAKTQ